MSKARRKKREFTNEFKTQMVNLYNSGKAKSEIIREYDLTRSAFEKWVKDYNNSRSFKAVDNRTAEENELIKLQKEIKQLRMENDILKQAALILGQK